MPSSIRQPLARKHAGEQTGAGWLRDSIQADYVLARALAPYLLSRLLRFVPYVKKRKKKKRYKPELVL